MSEKLFKFTVENTKTREKTHFIGQGETIEAALKEGIKNTKDRFRPRDGDGKDAMGIRVELPNGRFVGRSVEDFQGDAPFHK